MHPCESIQQRNEWSICPPEILWSIFKYLDTKALTKCMLVDRKWKDIAEHMALQYDLWEKIVRNEVTNKGAAIIRKSRLNWRNIYKNSILWHHIKNANIIHLKTYQIQDVKKIKVYNDYLIVINDFCASYYDINTSIKVAEFECIDLDENDYMIVELVHGNYKQKSLYLYDKTYGQQFDLPRNIRPAPKVMHDITLFRLVGKSCYVLSKTDVLWIVTYAEGLHNAKYLGRRYSGGYYDPIIDIHVWNESVYLITKWGTIWSYTAVTEGLQKAHKMFALHGVGYHDWVMFDKFSSVIKVPGNVNERVTVQYDELSDAMMLQSVELSSAMPHDDVLFLGYNDGRVEIRLPKKNITNTDPDRYFNIQEFCSEDEDSTVVALNVYEIENSHILYAVSRKVA